MLIELLGVISLSFAIMTFTFHCAKSPSLSTFYSESSLFLILAILCIFACMTCFISGSLFLVSANFNLVPYTLADFCDLKGCYLRLCSVAFTAQGALLCVMHTKTIQFQQRVLEIPSPYISGTALRGYLANSLCPDQSSLLGCRSHSLFQPILAHQCNAFIKASVAYIRLDPKKYTSHSFRCGRATSQEKKNIFQYWNVVGLLLYYHWLIIGLFTGYSNFGKWLCFPTLENGCYSFQQYSNVSNIGTLYFPTMEDRFPK